MFKVMTASCENISHVSSVSIVDFQYVSWELSSILIVFCFDKNAIKVSSTKLNRKTILLLAGTLK